MTREKAIEIIKCGDISNRWGKDGEEVEKMAIKALAQTRWIPVSERVPEDGEEVLCFLGSEEMAVLFRRNDWGQNEWVDGGFATGSYDVVAWMPLPKPYKAESEAES